MEAALHLAKEATEGLSRVFAMEEETYVLLGEDAEAVAGRFFRSVDAVQKTGDVPFVRVSPEKIANVLEFVLVELKKDVQMMGLREGDWALLKHASRGNAGSVGELLSQTVDATGTVLAVLPKGSMLGIAYLDEAANTIFLLEVEDAVNLVALESLLIQLSPQQCLLPATAPNMDALVTLLDACGVAAATVPSTNFASATVERDLETLTGQLPAPHLAAMTLAINASGALVDHCGLLRGSEQPLVLEMGRLDMFVRLDAAAVRALHLLPSATDRRATSSVYGLLNRCRSKMGSRMLFRWMKRPLVQMDDLTRRHDLVNAFVDDTEVRQSLHERFLRRVPDVERLLQRGRAGRATLQDLVQVYRFISQLEDMVRVMEQCRGPCAWRVHETFSQPLRDLDTRFEKLRQLVTETVDLAAADRREFRVLPTYSDALSELSKQEAELRTSVQSMLSAVAASLGLEEKHVKLNQSSALGFHFRVTRKLEKSLRGQDVIRLETRKDGVKFTTRELQRENTQLAAVKKDYAREQKAVADKVMQIYATYFGVMESSVGLLSELDIMVAFAVAAVEAPLPYVRPTMLPQGSKQISIEGARHPCLERQEGIQLIPNDVLLDAQGTMQVLSGPNMGGKSTYIRTVGIVSLMAQIGSFVPCTTATLTIVDAILARVGAGDHQLRGVSTFMAEMLEAASILRAATPDALIIIDELGRGTSTDDGFGLAWAIAEHIACEVGCFALFATHFHELKGLAFLHDTIRNKHMTAVTAQGALTMLYKVADGPSDESFGIHVAEIAKFPSRVLEEARRKVHELEKLDSDITPHIQKRPRTAT